MRLLVLDMDGTLWDQRMLHGSLHLTSSTVTNLTDAHGGELRLFSGVREFLRWAGERFPLSIASWNVEENVRPILERI